MLDVDSIVSDAVSCAGNAFALAIAIFVAGTFALATPASHVSAEPLAAPAVCEFEGELVDIDAADAAGEYVETFDAVVEVDEETRPEVLMWWSRLPLWVVRDMRDCMWRVVVTHEVDAIERQDFWDQSEHGDISPVGICAPARSLIIVETEQNQIGATLLHEVGHFVDWRYGNISRTDDFVSAYGADSKTFADAGRPLFGPSMFDKTEQPFDAYGTSSAVEFFAEAWRVSLCYPSTARLTCPNAYAMIEPTL